MKKLNNRGWGLTEMLILCSILMIALIVASIYIKTFDNNDETYNRPSQNVNRNKPNNNKPSNNNNNNKDDKYTQIEYKIELLSQIYIYEKYGNGIDESIIVVDMQHLLEQDSDGELKRLFDSNSCKGYSKVFKSDGIINYVPYLKCKAYSTIGFDDYYVE